MNSRRGRGSFHRGRIELGYFEQVDVADICYCSDEELYRALHALVEVREQGVKDGADLRPVEVEICYLRRELKIRIARREAHERYVRALQEENAALEQAVVMSTPEEAN